MADYLRIVEGLFDQLSSIGNPVSEEKKIFATLVGLGREYDEPIVNVILSSMDLSPGLTYEDVVLRLTGFENRLQGYSLSSVRSPTCQDYSRGRSHSSNSGYRGFHQQLNSSSSYSSESRTVCQICGKMGHLALTCPHRFDYSFQREDIS